MAGPSEGWLKAWSAQYPTDYDQEWIEGLRGKSTPTFQDVRRAVAWKSRRTLGAFNRNDRKLVEEISRRALRCPDELGALMMLTTLEGVGARVASAILTAFRPRRYTVMDRRAWDSLTAHGHLRGMKNFSWGASWLEYLGTCRRLAKRSGLPLRDVDRALWAAQGKRSMP